MSNSLSQQAAVANLKRFFANSGNSDSVAVDEIFVNAERADKSYERNMSWLYNKMSSMRKYDLFDKKYVVRNGVRALDRLVLTAEGKKALGKDETTTGSYAQTTIVTPTYAPDIRTDSSVASKETAVVTLQSISDIVDEFNRQNPSWEIEIVPKRVKKEDG